MDDSTHAAVAPASSVLSRVASSQVPSSWGFATYVCGSSCDSPAG